MLAHLEELAAKYETTTPTLVRLALERYIQADHA
jgi:hypothetical protein